MSNTVVLAPTRTAGREYIAERPDLKGSIIVTPRSVNALRGNYSVEHVVVTAPLNLSADFIAMLATAMRTA